MRWPRAPFASIDRDRTHLGKAARGFCNSDRKLTGGALIRTWCWNCVYRVQTVRFAPRISLVVEFHSGSGLPKMGRFPSALARLAIACRAVACTARPPFTRALRPLDDRSRPGDKNAVPAHKRTLTSRRIGVSGGVSMAALPERDQRSNLRRNLSKRRIGGWARLNCLVISVQLPGYPSLYGC